MKFFISVVIILVTLASGYLISSRRYAAVGCGITMKWGKRVNNRAKFLFMTIVILPIATLVYGPTVWLYTLCCFDTDESRLAATIITFLVMLGYSKLLTEMMKTGDHNGKNSAKKAAKRCKDHCRVECEYAGWGETVLECQNPTCLNCPLMDQYDIKPRIYRHDVLESIYRHERLERTMRRRGQTVPTSYTITIPIERVLNKVFDAEGWYDPFAEDIFATTETPVDTGACNIIPFPAQPQTEPEPAPSETEVPQAEVLEGEVIEDQPTPAPRRHVGYKKIAISRGDRGVKVEDCGTYLAIFLAWTDEAGEQRCNEYTIDKTSPDCIYLINDVAAIDFNAARKLQAMTIPAETF